MAQRVLQALTQQLLRAENSPPVPEWVTCSYIDDTPVSEETLTMRYRTGINERLEVQEGVNLFWNQCVARGYQVMPGCQGLMKNEAGRWYMEYHVDLRNRRKV